MLTLIAQQWLLMSVCSSDLTCGPLLLDVLVSINLDHVAMV